MKYIPLLFLISLLHSLEAQTYFSKNYHVSYNDAGWNVLALEDGILILDVSTCEGPTTCTSLLKTDFDGNLIWEVLLDSLRVANRNNILADSSGIYLAMYKKAAIEPLNVRLLKFDHNGNLLEYKRIGDGVDLELPLSMNWYDGKLLLSLDERYGDSTLTHMAFYTTDFDSVKTLPFVKDRGGTSSEFHLAMNGDLFHLRSINFLDGKTAKVIKTDEDGDIYWQKQFEKSISNFATSLALLPDGGCVTHWNKNATVWSEDTFEIVDYVVKLDADGHELWRHYFYDRNRHMVYDLFATENGDIVGCGQFNYFALPIEPDSSFIGSWIFRLDGNGQLKWIRHFNDARYESNQLLYSGTELTHQDLAFTGRIGFYGPPEGGNAWLLKVDSMGCITSGCGAYQTIVSAPDIPDSGLLFTLQPNPGSTATEVQLPQPAPEGCQIAVYNLLGRLVEQQTVPEGALTHPLALHGYSSGVYLAVVYERQKVVGRARLVVQH
jgi:hypothetical protein